MRSLFIAMVALLAVAQLCSAAQIQSVSFWNDSSCSTTPLNVASTYNLSEWQQWPNISSQSVYDLTTPPCANVSLGVVQSGTYECLSNLTNGPGGLLAMEYNAPSCGGNLVAIYEFLGAPGSACFAGQIQVFPSDGAGSPLTVTAYATVSCTNVSAAAPTSSSSSSSSSGVVSVSSSPSSSSASPSSTASPSSSSVSPSSASTVPSSVSTATGVVASSSASSGPVLVLSSTSAASPTGPNSINSAGESMSVVAALLAPAVLALLTSL